MKSSSIETKRKFNNIRNIVHKILRRTEPSEERLTQDLYLLTMPIEKKLGVGLRHNGKERSARILNENIHHWSARENESGDEILDLTLGDCHGHGVSIQINGIPWDGR